MENIPPTSFTPIESTEFRCGGLLQCAPHHDRQVQSRSEPSATAQFSNTARLEIPVAPALNAPEQQSDASPQAGQVRCGGGGAPPPRADGLGRPLPLRPLAQARSHAGARRLPRSLLVPAPPSTLPRTPVTVASVADRSGSEEGRRDLHRVDGPAYLESASERPSRWSRATCLERAIRLALCPNVCVRERGARHTSSFGCAALVGCNPLTRGRLETKAHGV